ncbi:hypothetical protein [Nodularia harveyana]|uniref:hypothetical protein n=1 Tax=Nodularia harveyana TaxID=114805 RepID=UPI00389944B1
MVIDQISVLPLSSRFAARRSQYTAQINPNKPLRETAIAAVPVALTVTKPNSAKISTRP